MQWVYYNRKLQKAGGLGRSKRYTFKGGKGYEFAGISKWGGYFGTIKGGN